MCEDSVGKKTTEKEIRSMHIEEIKEYLRFFYHAFRVPVSLVRQGEICASYTPVVLDQNLCLEKMRPCLNRDVPILYLEEQELFYGCVCNEKNGTQILVGPVSSRENLAKQVGKLKEARDFSVPQKHQFRYFLERTPVMNKARFFSLLRFLCYNVNGYGGQPEDIAEKKIGLSDKDFVEMSEALPEPLMEPKPIHNTERLEKEILTLIEKGNREALTEMLMQVPFMEIDGVRLGRNSLQTVKIVFIISVALCSRAAVRGGLDYEYAMSMSDQYIRELEPMEEPENIQPKMGLMMNDFCEKVRQLKKPKDVLPVTLQILSDVQANLYSRLRITEIAERLGKSASYLSHTFVKDMGQDLQSYIMQQKIEEAKRLLEYGEKSILEISGLLSFSSQSHFQKAFKAQTGKTPLQYRNEHP